VDEALDELGRLLDDGDVGREVGVEHRAEAQPAQRAVELPGEIGARRQAEGFADRHAHARGDLHDANLVLVVEGLPHGGGFVVLDDRAGRAVRGALAAFHARRLGQRDVAAGAMRVLMPRSRKESAHTSCISWHTWMQRPHLMHFSNSRMIEPVDLSRAGP